MAKHFCYFIFEALIAIITPMCQAQAHTYSHVRPRAQLRSPSAPKSVKVGCSCEGLKLWPCQREIAIDEIQEENNYRQWLREQQ